MAPSRYLERLKADFPDFANYIDLLDAQRAFILRQRLKGKTTKEIGQALGMKHNKINRTQEASCRQLRRILSRFHQDGKRLLTIAEVADMLGVHPNTVRRWSNLGILKAYHLGQRGDRRFRREDVDRFLELGKQ